MTQVFAAINHRLSEEYAAIDLPSQESKERYASPMLFASLHSQLCQIARRRQIPPHQTLRTQERPRTHRDARDRRSREARRVQTTASLSCPSPTTTHSHTDDPFPFHTHVQPHLPPLARTCFDASPRYPQTPPRPRAEPFTRPALVIHALRRAHAADYERQWQRQQQWTRKQQR